MGFARPSLTQSICGTFASKTSSRAKNAGVPDQRHDAASVDHCALYKSRCQVELFFNWIKRSLDTSENAVKRQIWCALSAYVRIAIVMKDL